MAPAAVQTIIRELTGIIRQQLQGAADLALAAEARAEVGGFDQAVEIAKKIDERTHDAGQLLNALAVVWRRYGPASPDTEADDE
jgi:hypothetical protein